MAKQRQARERREGGLALSRQAKAGGNSRRHRRAGNQRAIGSQRKGNNGDVCSIITWHA